MSLRRTIAIARKEFRHILRDSRTFFLVAVSPAFLLLMLSHIFSFDIEQVEVAVWDMDQTSISRQYLAALSGDRDVRLLYRVASYDEVSRLLEQRAVAGALIIPSGFEQNLRAGRQVWVEAVIDGSDPIAAGQAASSLAQRTAAFADQFRDEQLALTASLELRTIAWYNPALKSLYSMVPGLIALVLCMPALALSLALTREKETGSFESLIATPVRGPEYLFGKLIAYGGSGMVSVLLVWLVAVFYFRVPFRGSLALYFLLAGDYLLASMGFSLFIANFVRSQQTAMLLVLMIFFVPSFFVAGLIYPVSHTQLVSQLVAYSLPTTHFIAIARGLFLKGVGLWALQAPAIALASLGTGGILFSLLIFRKRLV